jgi:uncharacterized protein (TIGR02646 family)
VRRIKRLPLDRPSAAELKRLTARVGRGRTAAARANRLWKTKSKAVFANIQGVLGKMASGRGRCMYCEDSAGTDIEHFYPKSLYPARAFHWPNYLWACSYCNSNRKRTQFPLHRKRPALIDPSAVDPMRHLQFLPSTGEYAAIGPRGTASIRVFGLNDTSIPRKLPQARKDAFDKLQRLLEAYDSDVKRGKSRDAHRIKEIVRGEPFSAVLGWLVSIASTAAGPIVLRRGIPALVKKHGVARW